MKGYGFEKADSPSIGVAAGTWFHFALTWPGPGNNFKTYINGAVLKTSAPGKYINHPLPTVNMVKGKVWFVQASSYGSLTAQDKAFSGLVQVNRYLNGWVCMEIRMLNQSWNNRKSGQTTSQIGSGFVRDWFTCSDLNKSHWFRTGSGYVLCLQGSETTLRAKA